MNLLDFCAIFMELKLLSVIGLTIGEDHTNPTEPHFSTHSIFDAQVFNISIKFSTKVFYKFSTNVENSIVFNKVFNKSVIYYVF